MIISRTLEKRLLRAERWVKTAIEKKSEQETIRAKMPSFWARFHAASVLALVLHGAVNPQERLLRAQRRAQEKLRDLVGTEAERQCREFAESQDMDLRACAKVHYPRIMLEGLPGKDERSKFARVFASAPLWLLKFTAVERDALLLGFNLPDLSGAPQLGREARRDRDNWPFLPIGTVAAGGPCDDPDPPLTLEQILTRIRSLEH